ncbi:hypothetical protein OHR68_30335 [Spirillospora sp. NBC_00431]
MDVTDGSEEEQRGSEDLQSKMLDFRQGDIVSVPAIPLLGGAGNVEDHRTPLGAAVISQTCDLVQPDRVTAQLALVRELDPIRAKEAASGKRPRFVALPEYGANLFADLEVIATVSKDYLATLARKPGVPESDNTGGRFGRAVGRRFSRFPFPDELHPYLKPLQDLLQSKASKTASPLGLALESVTTLRLESTGGWRSSPPFNLVLLIVVAPGVLPDLDDSLRPLPKKLADWAYKAGSLYRSPAQIASKLTNAADPVDLTHLWQMLGDALADNCLSSGLASEHATAVEAIEAEVIGEDEFTYDRYLRSEELDLDHLSPPTPW